MKSLENAKNKPDDYLNLIRNIYSCKDSESIEVFYKSITDFTNWGLVKFNWPSQFVADSELNWLNGNVPIADI